MLPLSMAMQRAARWVEVSRRGGNDPRLLEELRQAKAEYIAAVGDIENMRPEGVVALLAGDYLMRLLDARIAGEQVKRDKRG